MNPNQIQVNQSIDHSSNNQLSSVKVNDDVKNANLAIDENIAQTNNECLNKNTNNDLIAIDNANINEEISSKITNMSDQLESIKNTAKMVDFDSEAKEQIDQIVEQSNLVSEQLSVAKSLINNELNSINNDEKLSGENIKNTDSDVTKDNKLVNQNQNEIKLNNKNN